MESADPGALAALMAGVITDLDALEDGLDMWTAFSVAGQREALNQITYGLRFEASRFAVRPEYSPAVASSFGLTPAPNIRSCLQRQMGRVAERNSCRGEWTESLNRGQ